MQTDNIQHFLHPDDKSKFQQETATFVVLPFPLEKTTSYVTGTQKGPQAILDASSQVEYFDPELGYQALDHGIFTDHSLMQLDYGKMETQQVLAKASEIVKNHMANDKFVLTLGGEHTITPGVAKPFLDTYQKDITVIHIDAHADLKDEYEGTPYSHACAIARIVDQSPIISIGIRSVDQQEYDFAKQHPLINTFYSHEMAKNSQWIDDVIDMISTKYVYFTIDLDGLDPSIMPAVGTPQPGGLLWNDVCQLLSRSCQKATLVGADVNELCPLPNHHASTFMAAKLCYKIMGYSLLQSK